MPIHINDVDLEDYVVGGDGTKDNPYQISKARINPVAIERKVISMLYPDGEIILQYLMEGNIDGFQLDVDGEIIHIHFSF